MTYLESMMKGPISKLLFAMSCMVSLHGSSRISTGNSGGERYLLILECRLFVALAGPQIWTSMEGSNKGLKKPRPCR
jgi:hypothetical protein